MTVRQQVDGDRFTWTTGSNGLATLASGAYTIAAIARRFPHNDMGALLALQSGTSGINMIRYDEQGKLGALHSGAQSASTGITWKQNDGWVLVAVTFPGGTSAVRGHKIPLAGGSAVHQDSAVAISANATACDRAETGWNSDDDWAFRGRLAIMAAWNSVLSDTALEGLVSSRSDWVAASPLTLWRFDQELKTEPVDDQVGDAHQVDIDGTHVVTDDDPPGFSWNGGNGGGGPVATGYVLNGVSGPALATTITGPGV